MQHLYGQNLIQGTNIHLHTLLKGVKFDFICARRIQIAVDIEKGMMDNKVRVRQQINVHFIIKSKKCEECLREASAHTWSALIQFRQNVEHRRSLYIVEQLLAEHDVIQLILDAEVVKGGLNLYFRNQGSADKVIGKT